MKERENSNRLRRRAEGRKARRETRSEERIRADAEEMGLHRSTDGGGGGFPVGTFLSGGRSKLFPVDGDIGTRGERSFKPPGKIRLDRCISQGSAPFRESEE